MKTIFKLTCRLALILIFLLQSSCAVLQDQKKTATSAVPGGPSVTFTQSASSVPTALAVTPGSSTPSEMPALTPLTPPAPTVQVYYPPQTGIGFGAFLDVKVPDYGMALMAAAGMNWVHIPFYWSFVEKKAGERNWSSVSKFEAELRSAAEKHINAIIYVNDTPGWALKSGYTCGAVAQDKFTDMASFLGDMVKRYSAPPFNVKYFELWSEEDVSGFLGCWGDPNDPAFFGGGYYGEMLKVAYPAIKAADPQAQVLFGGLLMDCDPNHVEYCGGDPNDKRRIGRFLEGALIDGAGPYFDGISFHGYDYYGGALGAYSNANWGAAWNTTGPVALVKATYLRSLLARYNLTGKYLMNTELALLCGRTGLEAPCTTPDHAKTLSAYLVESYASGIAFGLSTVIWFSVAGWRGSALVDARANPLAGYTSYQFASASLAGAAFVKPLSDYPGIYGYEFSRDGKSIWVLWSIAPANNPQTITLSAPPLAVFNADSSSLPVGISVNIGLEPIFIGFGP